MGSFLWMHNNHTGVHRRPRYDCSFVRPRSVYNFCVFTSGLETERRAFAALLAKFSFMYSSHDWDSVGDAICRSRAREITL